MSNDYSGVPLLPVADNDTLAERRGAADARHWRTVFEIREAKDRAACERMLGVEVAVDVFDWVI